MTTTTTTSTSTSMSTATTTTPPARRRRGPRGWLLVEVTVGGVMASVVLGALLVNVGDSMDKSSIVGRRLTAQMLAKQGIEQARAIANPQANLPDGTVTIAAPSTLRGSYTRTRVVSSGVTTIGTNTVNFKDVTVTVTFPNKTATKTVSLQTRIYDP